MKICQSISGCFLFAAAAFAEQNSFSHVRPVADTPTLNHVLRAAPSLGPMTMDGDLNDWDMSGAIVIADSIAAPRRMVRVAAMYDMDGLYLSLHFKDRTPMVNHIDPVVSPGHAWRGDCVQLRINTGPYPDQTPLKPMQIIHLDAYWYTDGGRPSAHVVYGDFSPGGKTHKTIAEAEGNGVRSAYRKDADGLGYVQELGIAWKLLRPDNGRPYKPGESMHMAIEAMWGNPRYRNQPANRVSDLLNPQRSERDHLWANAMAWGKVEFMEHGKLEQSETAKLWDDLSRKFAELDEELPPAAAANAAPAVDRPRLSETTDVEKKLNSWYAAGTAAGNVGDYYDNRDREHSALNRKEFPQVKSYEYSPDQKFENRDHGFFSGVRNFVTFGNSSTAAPPERGGCNPRLAIMSPAGPARLYAQYRSGNLYVYPAHHDYHPGRNGDGFWGDLLPMNTPYYILSRGSSGSDIPFLNALFHTSAAFRPDVKKMLVHQGLLIPTIQQIMRSAYKANISPEDYFTGKAHPAVFEGNLLDELKMVETANAMTLETIPPLAQLHVFEAEALVPGKNAPEFAMSEKIYETPCAVGFVFRGWDRHLKLNASAESSYDWQGKPLSFRWELLQGIPELVRIEPYDGGRRAKISVAWHDRFPVQPGSDIWGNRVDIGLFANNGKSWSAPAIISIVCPDSELRTYDEKGRLVDINYAAMDTSIGYVSNCVMPAEGIVPYHIRDWIELMKMIAFPEASLCGKFSAKFFNAKEREELASVAAKLADESVRLAAERQAARPPGNVNQRWFNARQDAEKLSRFLLDQVPDLGGSVKYRIEKMLNAWQEDPSWYLDNKTVFDEALAKAPKDVQDKISAARDNLVKLGIYVPDGTSWKLQSWRKGAGSEADRLTQAERSELKKFHLLLKTQLLLPKILVRYPRFNYTDSRIIQARPEWLAMEYDGDSMRPSAVKVRSVSSPLPH